MNTLLENAVIYLDLRRLFCCLKLLSQVNHCLFFTFPHVDVMSHNFAFIVCVFCSSCFLFFSFIVLYTFFHLLFVDINECQNNPCQNGGRCTNVNGDYSCSCVSGFEGKNCEKGKDSDEGTYFSKLSCLLTLHLPCCHHIDFLVITSIIYYILTF